jgi:dihydroorotase
VKKTVFGILLFFQLQFLFAQHADLLIKGGHVIDPKNNINGIYDVAISKGKITRIARHMGTQPAAKVIDARGLYVVPGFIDIHTHDFYGPDSTRHFCNGTKSLMPDTCSFCTGTTTVVDAGSSGWMDFPVFKKQVIDKSRTRVFAFLNIVGEGMRGPAYEQDTNNMDGKKTAAVAQLYRKYIVGIKLAHYKGSGWKPVEEAISAGRLAGMPVMIDFGDSPSPMSVNELLMLYMRPGDIFTHCFAELKGREPIFDPDTKTLKPFVWEAKKRGVCFDVGYGAISFSFSQAIPTVKAGFYPNTISTDKHATTKNKIKDLPEIMSEFLALGMSIGETIAAVTWNPAKEIHHQELGNISVGSIADIAILNISNNKMMFYDHSGNSITGAKEIKCAVTIKSGEIVYHAD